jgi:hypothetical protein
MFNPYPGSSLGNIGSIFVVILEMKKMKSLLIALMVAGSVAALAGNGEPRMTVVPFQGTDVYKVIYKGNEVSKVRLNIRNAHGGVLHSETITGMDGFIRPLNLKSLSSGAYTIELIDGNDRFVEQIILNRNQDQKAIHVSRIVDQPGKFLLAVVNARDESIRIRIYDNRSRLVHDEERVVSGDFAQVYNVHHNAPGRYSFEVVDAKGKSKYFWF